MGTLVDVADTQAHIHELLGQRRDGLPIAVEFDHKDPIAEIMLDLARERGWKFFGLGKFSGHLPTHVAVRGALTFRLPDDPTSMLLLRSGIPAVRIGTWPHPEDHRMPAVMSDRLACGRLAAEHFAQRGFKHVGFVGRNPWHGNEEVYNVFASRARELGCACHLLRFGPEKSPGGQASGPDTAQPRRSQFENWLRSLPLPIGLLGFGDYAADLYCQWCIEVGLRVPEDVAVLGIGDERFICESAAVPLSSIRHDLNAIAGTAIQTLERLMAGQTLEQTTIMVPPLGVVTRRSTDVLAASDPMVVAALRFMWDHVDQNPSVQQIARHVRVSRRMLERAFEKDLGRGINAELQRRRLEKACELLRRTDWPIQDIAKYLKYSSNRYFGDAFRHAFAISPGQYRRDRRDRQSHP